MKLCGLQDDSSRRYAVSFALARSMPLCFDFPARRRAVATPSSDLTGVY